MLDGDGEATAVRFAQFELTKVSPDDLVTLPVVERFPASEFELTPEKQEKFEALLARSIEQTNGGWIEYNLPWPKHEFVQYVTAQDKVIFHGSNNKEIDEFQPVRKSIELMDDTGRGNVQGVYGTHAGLWSMFFAIIDRSNMEGSIRNGVMYFNNRDGQQFALYQFSIDQNLLEDKPVVEGALYLLPRATFKRLMLTEATYSNEWASEQPVKPYAKLLIKPEDFPFLDQISGHDDSQMIRLNRISKAIHSSARSASLNGDSFEVRLPADAEVVAELEEYIALQKVMMPASKYEVEKETDDVKLIITGLQPAVKQVISDSYKDLLENSERS